MKESRLAIWSCLDEIEAVCRLASKPMIEKHWKQCRKWHKLMRKTLLDLGYDKKIRRYPKWVFKATPPPKEVIKKVLIKKSV